MTSTVTTWVLNLTLKQSFTCQSHPLSHTKVDTQESSLYLRCCCAQLVHLNHKGDFERHHTNKITAKKHSPSFLDALQISLLAYSYQLRTKQHCSPADPTSPMQVALCYSPFYQQMQVTDMYDVTCFYLSHCCSSAPC